MLGLKQPTSANVIQRTFHLDNNKWRGSSRRVIIKAHNCSRLSNKTKIVLKVLKDRNEKN